MKTSMKFFMCLLIALALAATTSCKKDSLEDAVLTPTEQGETGSSGTNGENGSNGQDGAQGEQGASGADGQNGQDGADGAQGEQGIQGEQGEQGVQGEQGLQGEQGVAGEDGEDGNANVIYSSWLNADWNLTDAPKRKMMQIEVNDISLNELRNNTLVYVYFQQYGTSSIYAMNGSGRWSNVEYAFTFGDNSACCGGILIRLTSKDGADLTELQYAGFRGNRFRYVLIPANVSSAKLDFSNYEAVKAFFNLTD